ncbi:MAG: type IV toxin-antitoxin system AbiEi family antitoxin domain-containing protein [Marmoricola sp.]
MDPQLALDLAPGPSLVDGPFTPAMARSAGLPRAGLERMLREGRVTRLLRGVYVGTHVALDPSVRSRAVALVVPPDAVVVDRTAAWVHGVEVLGPHGEVLPPLEALRRASGRSSRRRHLGGRRRLVARDVGWVAGVTVTTPLRTALDLGRLLAPARAQAAVDGFLRSGLCSQAALRAELPRFARHHGIVQLRHVVALADERSASPAESVLRFHWSGSRLPSPVPGLLLGDAGLRLALGVPDQRFGVLVGAVDADRLRAASLLGWRVVPLAGHRVLHSDPELVLGHVECEFHRHLLGQVEQG